MASKSNVRQTVNWEFMLDRALLHLVENAIAMAMGGAE
jgi:hypothetical protein